MNRQASGRRSCEEPEAKRFPERSSPSSRCGYILGVSVRLRDYMYLDEDLVERLLSQVEGGVSSEETQTDVEKLDKRRGGGVQAAPLKAELGRTKATEISASRTVRQTPDSACSRLIDTLEQADSLQFLEVFDDTIWGQLRRGEALEIDATIELSVIAQLGGIAESVEPLMAVMSSAGQEIDTDGLEAIKAFSALSGLMKAIPVLVRPTGAPDYTFIASLKADALRIDQDQLNGEATILGTLQRRLRQDEVWSIFDAFGLAGLPQSLRKQMQQNMAQTDTDSELGAMVVKPPAALLNTIAIYR